MKVKSEREVAQSCLTLSDPMDCSLLGSSIHEIFQARVLEWGAIAFSRKNEETEAKQKQHPVVYVTGDRSKVRYCKEQYCIVIWNVRSMNQGKLEVIKQEMARVNIDILGISELNGLEWMNLIQMTIISTTVGKNALEEMK